MASNTPSRGTGGFNKARNHAAKAAALRLASVMRTQNDVDDEEDDDYGYRGYNGPPAPVAVPVAVPVASYRSNSPAQQRAASAGRLQPPQLPSQPQAPSFAPPVRPRAVALFPPSRDPPEPTGFGGTRSRTSATPEPPPPLRVGGGGSDRRAEAALRDEIDLLTEENQFLLDKLRAAEEKLEGSEARARDLEKQVSSLGEGISLEARLLSRKEAALKQREQALKSAQQQVQGTVKDDELAAVRQEAEKAREQLEGAKAVAEEAQNEVRALRQATGRMTLTQEEMEEVALKRCWLARYWGLAARHGVHPEIASTRHEHWSCFAPLPLEVVLAAGQKAKEGLDAEPEGEAGRSAQEANGNGVSERRGLHRRSGSAVDLSADNSIENMLIVEKGLRELAALKVEDAVLLAMAQHRRPSLVRSTTENESGAARLVESMNLSEEEVEDVQFKQAWLCYFWRRARRRGVEKDMADERLRYWIGRGNQNSTAHDAVDVERGLIEMRRLGLELQLWESSRTALSKELEEESRAALEEAKAQD